MTKANTQKKTIVRVQKNRENPYVMLDKRFLDDDDRLSWKAKGLLSYLLSKPDDWTVLIVDLVKQSTDGEKSVRSGLKELEACGYLTNKPVRDERGRILYWEKIVYERPHNVIEIDTVVSPDADFVHVEKVHVENGDTTNTDLTNKPDTLNNDSKNNSTDVAVVQGKIESQLGASIKSLLPLLAQWLQEYGEESLVRTAQSISSRRTQYKNVIGAYRSAVTQQWNTEVTEARTETVHASQTQDNRYEAFYNLFPDMRPQAI